MNFFTAPLLLTLLVSLFLGPASCSPEDLQPSKSNLAGAALGQMAASSRQPAAPGYQSPVSYAIQARLDPPSRTLEAHETITYTNITTGTIPDLVFHLYLNAFKNANTVFMRESGGQLRMDYWDPQHPGWIDVTRLALKGGTLLKLELLEDGTLARAVLPQPLAPGQTIQLSAEFKALLPRVFARTGYAADASGKDFFMVGQWFPKLGVRQKNAWNAYVFHANSEFFADFSSYRVDITLPAGWTTGGVGMPVRQSSSPGGLQTVSYRADRVIDFSWTASPSFKSVTDHTGDVEILYLYLPEHEWTVARVLSAARAAVNNFSGWYGRYPYPRLTIVDVPDAGEGAGGMEYPTLVTAGVASFSGVGSFTRLGFDRTLEAVVIHEIGHQWWYAMVAFNEAEEPWLDEGFTDYSTARVMDRLYGPGSTVAAGNLKISYLDYHRAQYEGDAPLPMFGKAWDFSQMQYGIAAYSKPVLSLTTLEKILGDERMLQVMSTFFRRYQYAHPSTRDFQAVAEEVFGQKLDWFFEGLVYSRAVVNYRVRELDASSVTVERQGDLVIPTEVQLNFADGSQVRETWDGSKAIQKFTYRGKAPVVSAQVDPDRKILVDLEWSDNGLRRQADVDSWLAVLVRLLYQLQNALLLWGGL